jgi:hypothetical protein
MPGNELEVPVYQKMAPVGVCLKPGTPFCGFHFHYCQVKHQNFDVCKYFAALQLFLSGSVA